MKNIIFDFGEVFVRMGTFITTLEKLDCIKNPKEFLEKYDEFIKRSFVDNTIDIYKIIEEYSGENGITKQEILEYICKNTNKSLIQKIPELSKKYNLYILSNISSKELIPFFLEKHNISQYFSGMVESCNVGYVKPDDNIYQVLINMYDLEPSESIFFDDREENIKGAQKNGIHAVLYDDFDIDIQETIIKL